MCDTCGCNQPADAVKILLIGEETKLMHDPHDHEHGHGHHHHHHHHDHEHTHGGKTVIELEQDVLAQNNRLAERNRGYFEAKNILALNLVSSPGSGKTAVLERTLADLKDELAFFVIEGDQQTTRDADRIAATGAPVVQVNTGKGCHLDSDMVNRAVKKLTPSDGAIVMIENVGNLVCPSLFDLGESRRVVIISVTEGDDKPLKYPDMFHTSDLCLINKVDLLPYVPFDVEKAKHYALHANPKLQFLEISALTGQGMEEWYDWLRSTKNQL
ncbi:MAG: hydrogenase nickel incorporation protein HypB [Lewinellaceae bacterium]|nr:hydrogenase nickel incorporation protein HypB [Lewinellaceae bacterium]